MTLSLRCFSPTQFLMATVLSVALTYPVQARESVKQLAARRAIAAQYTKGDQAFIRKDAAAIMADIAPDFQLHMRSGMVMNRSQYQAIQSLAFQNVSNIGGRTKIQKIEWRGPDAIVWAESNMQWMQRGTRIQTTGTTRDYWSLIKGKWMIRQSAELQSQTFANGNPVTSG